MPRAQTGRILPTVETLRENNITIFHEPDKSRWPDYVRELELKLVSSFAGLIPESAVSKLKELYTILI